SSYCRLWEHDLYVCPGVRRCRWNLRHDWVRPERLQPRLPPDGLLVEPVLLPNRWLVLRRHGRLEQSNVCQRTGELRQGVLSQRNRQLRSALDLPDHTHLGQTSRENRMSLMRHPASWLVLSAAVGAAL